MSLSRSVCVTCDFFLLLPMLSVSVIYGAIHSGSVAGDSPAA
jgi:hypothetical protein